MEPTPNLAVAAVQLCSTGDRAGNLQRAQRLMERAVRAGARLVCLPENFGYLDREGEKLRFVESLGDGPAVSLARTFAERHRVFVAAGTVPLAGREPGRVTNTLTVWGPDGSLAARYDKLHLFDIMLDERHDFRESRYIEAGRTLETVNVDGWTIGLSICYDLRFPELYRALADRGAEVLLVPSAFTAKTGKAHWELLLRARAVENLSYVVAPAQWGRHNERRESWGRTMVVTPWGEVLTEQREGEGIVVAQLDRDRLQDVRRRLPSLDHRRIAVGARPEVEP